MKKPIVFGLLGLIVITGGLLIIQRVRMQQATVNDGIAPGGEVIYILDRGWITGSNQQQFLAVPQALAWNLGNEQPVWKTESGIIYDGLLDEASGQLYLLNLQYNGAEDLLGVKFNGNELWPPSQTWPLMLTILNAQNGEVVQEFTLSNSLDGPASLSLVGINGQQVLFQDLSQEGGLLTFDLGSGGFTGEAVELCIGGNTTLVEVTPDKSGVVSLCNDFSSADWVSWLSAYTLDSGTLKEIGLPLLGEENYMTGNGLLLSPDGSAIVIDSDAGILVSVDLATETVGEKVAYRTDEVADSNLLERLTGWLSVRTAHAKRWFSVNALSPDGRWLVVDGGFLNGPAAEIWLVDLTTMKTHGHVALSDAPAVLAFDGPSHLLALLQKDNAQHKTVFARIDLKSLSAVESTYDLGAFPEFLMIAR